MTETKETLRKVINVSKTLGVQNVSEGQFTVNMLVDFAPDIVIVRQIAYYQNAALVGAYNVYNPELDCVLGSFIDPSCTSPNTIIKIGKHINQTQTFKIYRAGLDAIASTLTGDLSITLEFIKYNDTSKKVGIEAF